MRVAVSAKQALTTRRGADILLTDRSDTVYQVAGYGMAEQRRAKPSRPDRRTTNTRARILQHAEQLYYSGGYVGISLQQLAADLGLTKPALFHHFRSKQDLFFAMLLEMLEQRRARIEDAIATASGTEERLRAILHTMAACPFFDPMKFLTDERGKLRPEQQREIEVAFAHAVQEPIGRVLAEGVERSELRPHPPALGVMVFLNLMMLLPAPGHPNPRLAASVASDPSTYIEELLAFFTRGIGSTGRPQAQEGSS